MTKINLGSGRKKFDGFTNIDIAPYLDVKGNQLVDVVMDVEKDPLPFEDNSVDEVLADNVLEHLQELRFVLNECHRVLKPGKPIKGMVPIAGTNKDFKDPTHKRHFIRDTFSYFTGVNLATPAYPSRPKYANYGFKPWIEVKIYEENDMVHFEMTPRK